MSRFPKYTGREILKNHLRLPSWITKNHIRLNDLHKIKTEMRSSILHTVCEEARCPNRTQCFKNGTATFLIMGNICTRACSFCSIETGKPLPLNPLEPQDIAKQILKMKLQFAVITSVTRDDLADGGATHFANTIYAIKDIMPKLNIEVLTPDFMGNLESITKVITAGPTVFNHNIETVPRLYPLIRPSSFFDRTIKILKEAKYVGSNILGPNFHVKSGLMLGFGETDNEILEVCNVLKESGVDILTLGQYLRPTRYQTPVINYIKPEDFKILGEKAKKMGFRTVYSGPTVRSSFNASEINNVTGLFTD